MAVSRVSFRPGTSLSWRSAVVLRVLSVLHFSVKVRPRSATLYLVSRLPATLPESMLEEPPLVNSTPVSVLVFTSSLRRPKWYPLPNTSEACLPRSPYLGGPILAGGTIAGAVATGAGAGAGVGAGAGAAAGISGAATGTSGIAAGISGAEAASGAGAAGAG